MAEAAKGIEVEASSMCVFPAAANPSRTVRPKGGARKEARQSGDRAFELPEVRRGDEGREVAAGDRVLMGKGPAPNSFSKRDLIDDEDDNDLRYDEMFRTANKRGLGNAENDLITKSVKRVDKKQKKFSCWKNKNCDKTNKDGKEISSCEGTEHNGVLESVKRIKRSDMERKQRPEERHTVKGNNEAQLSKCKSYGDGAEEVRGKGSKDDDVLQTAKKQRQMYVGKIVSTKRLRVIGEKKKASPSKDKTCNENSRKGKKMLIGENVRMCHQCQRSDKERVVQCNLCRTKRFCVPCMQRWCLKVSQYSFLPI